MRKLPFIKMQSFFSFLFIFGMLLAPGIARAEVIFVNVNNLNPVQDGSSWRTAFVSLQAALDKAGAVSGDNDIWVAKGAYFPTKIYAPSDIPGGASGLDVPNLATFDLPDGVSIFGGFNGTETKLKQRDPKKNRTILSGAGTSWHVVILGNDIDQSPVTAKLDGLRIVQGNAQGPVGSNSLTQPFTFGHSYGGGVYVAFGSVIKIKDVLFAGNFAAVEGGAFFSSDSTVHIKESRFISNSAGLEGGAIEILNTFEICPHTSIIESSLFKGNSAVTFGGAIVVEGTIQKSGSFSEIKDCIFEHNSSQIGGAIAVDSIEVNVLNSVFKNNIASVAAGALSTTNLVNTIATAFHVPQLPFTPFTTTISGCKFSRNMVQGNLDLHDSIFGGPAVSGVDFPLGGGAVAVYLNGYLNVDKSEFRNNVAQNSNGGAILNGRSAGEDIIGSGANGFIVRTKVTNSLFVGNESPTENGGAIASLPSTVFASLPITVDSTFLSAKHSTFQSNLAGLAGGAIYLNFSTAKLKKNCFAHNQAAMGRSIFGINSVINCDTTSPFIKP